MDGEGDRSEAQDGGDMGVPMAGSCWCLTENNKILLSNYPSIKKYIKKKTLGRGKKNNAVLTLGYIWRY